MLSDFVVPPDLRGWQRALEHRWELVPVVIQDPVWERTFPDVGGVTIPYADPATGRVVPVCAHATARRPACATSTRRAGTGSSATSARSASSRSRVTSHDLAGVLESFLRWADLRQMWRGALA